MLSMHMHRLSIFAAQLIWPLLLELMFEIEIVQRVNGHNKRLSAEYQYEKRMRKSYGWQKNWREEY